MPLGHAERHLQGRHKDTGNDKGFKREIVLQGYPKDTPRIPKGYHNDTPRIAQLFPKDTPRKS